ERPRRSSPGQAFRKLPCSSRRLGRPVMPLLGSKAQPGKQSIVDNKTSLKQSMIVVPGECRESEGNRIQPAPLLGDVVPGGVRATHDQSQSRQGGLALKSKDSEHG